MGIDYTMRVCDDGPCSVAVGGELAVSLHIEGNTIKRTWANDWDKWAEMHAHPKFQELQSSYDGIVERAARGKTKSSKGRIQRHFTAGSAGDANAQ
eukprot:4705970-Pyramimonas_sp.AAC.1